MTVMGDALRDRLSDRGSIPLRSTGEHSKDVVWLHFLGVFMLQESIPCRTLSC